MTIRELSVRALRDLLPRLRKRVLALTYRGIFALTVVARELLALTVLAQILREQPSRTV